MSKNNNVKSLMNKNGTKLWTNSEIKLLFDQDLSNEDIAQLTGRTLQAVKDKRYRECGEFIDFKLQRKMEGEARILKKAKELHIKLACEV